LYQKKLNLNKTTTPIILAYSGGLESSFILFSLIQQNVNFIAVTIDNGLIPSYHKKFIQKTIETMKINHTFLSFDYKKIKPLRENSKQRCYYCKKEMFTLLKIFADTKGGVVIDGTAHYDLNKDRPGLLAKQELNILSPLTKQYFSRQSMINILSENNFPFMINNTCLITRFPVENKLNKERLSIIENCESLLWENGAREFRIRVKNKNHFQLEIKNYNINIEKTVEECREKIFIKPI